MPDVQQFLARLYVDDALRARFIAAPFAEALAFGFDEATAREIALMNVEDLELAARSFARKRGGKHGE